MKFFSATLIQPLVAAAAVLFGAQAGYALLSLDNHYAQVQRQVQGWCEKSPGCTRARFTGNLSAPEITVDYRGKVRDRSTLESRVAAELQSKGLLTLERSDGVAAQPVSIRVEN